MTKWQIAAVAATVLVVAVGIVVRMKRISPLSWGWYGAVQTTDGAAAGGYDPISYFSGQPVRGNPSVHLTWHGVEWRFANVENRTRFEAEPERYAPQFGGFCAYASSKGFTATVDPMAYRVEKGQLYLFNDASMRDKWIAELPSGVIERARRKWSARVP